MKDIMLDIETLGHNPNSAIIQVSMAYFDRYTGKIDRTMKCNVSKKSSLYYGLTTNKSTLDWWQSTPELRQQFDEMNKRAEGLKYALKRVSDFISPSARLWSYANFDIPILESAFIATGMRLPWNYKNVRDIRTLTDLADLDLKTLDWSKKTHDSMDDVKFQIEYCVKCFRKLKFQSILKHLLCTVLFVLLVELIVNVGNW